ncbi:helix-turn-helix domain-containing protein [Streptomyces sp. SID13031]|uniref:helix-turn-helix domain-containing protein n=1 Tax=Streptomyces sp. SID13031 TaxID=2706046 RepID=UPI0013CB7831|nr:helix-turn-helix domain-containing protein [Streptomyces sp. SID13031]NEA30772.1 transcriptional regulator [Streptomyces sp. SID13031]
MKLNVLGLTDETERVYTALVGQPQCTASELAVTCGLTAATAGRLLSALVRDGLATRTAGRPPRFSGTVPDVAVAALIDEQQHRLDEARSLVHRLMESYREAARITHPEMAVELLTDRDDISSAVSRMTADARREVRAFDRPPYVDRPGVNLDLQIQRQRSGVSHRVIYSQEAVAWPGRMTSDIGPSIRAGEKARVRPELPLKLVISDNQVAIIPFSLAAGGQSAAYLIHQSPMLVALESLFEGEWERAVALADAGPQAGDNGTQPDDDTHCLLELLAAGLTDAAIARSQGWSERTTQRRIHRLMHELGASTRFQASLTAARRGWL